MNPTTVSPPQARDGDPEALSGTSPEVAGEGDLILVISYDDRSRAAIVASPRPPGLLPVACSSFLEAQDHALSRPFRGGLVDLATMVKTRDLEKIIAHTVTSIYPTLRVKSMGPMLIPMIMSGDAKQDKSLSDFYSKSCAEFTPRRLRSHKRRDLCLPLRIGTERGYTVNVSLGGLFIANLNPERFTAGQELAVTLVAAPGVEFAVQVQVVRIQEWGERRPPGIGVRFITVDQELEQALYAILRCDKDTDRDRLTV